MPIRTSFSSSKPRPLTRRPPGCLRCLGGGYNWTKQDRESSALVSGRRGPAPRARQVFPADMLDSSEPLVKGALQRARATLQAQLPAGDRERAPVPDSPRARELVGRASAITWFCDTSVFAHFGLPGRCAHSGWDTHRSSIRRARRPGGRGGGGGGGGGCCCSCCCCPRAGPHGALRPAVSSQAGRSSRSRRIWCVPFSRGSPAPGGP
jgi:hypothetical protein